VTPDVTVCASAVALADAAAAHIATLAGSAVRARGRFVIALSGGTTPRATYRRLADPAFAAEVPWAQVHVVWGDERCVPPGDPMSNYGMARTALLDRVPVPEPQIHRIAGEIDPALAGQRYEATQRRLLGTPEGPPQSEPGARIDLVLLGLGDDGHTASLFPGSGALAEVHRWAVPVVPATVPTPRVTLTLPVIAAAAEILFLVSGAAKARILGEVLDPAPRPSELPARSVARSSGSVRWIVDAPAATALT
jgi:6-phosphogluconolactonase